MPSLKISLLILAGLIIVILAVVAVYYHRKANRHLQQIEEQQEQERRQAQENLDKRNNELIADIRFIANSMLQEQCELTEGVLRIHHLSDRLDADIMRQVQFASLHQHFNQTRDMPILDAYKALSKRDRFQLDKKRLQLEATNKDAVMAEVKQLVAYRFDSLKQLH